jgi:hypothetical protein
MQGFSILGYTARWDFKKKNNGGNLALPPLFFALILVCYQDIKNDRQNDEYKGKNRRDTTEDLILGLGFSLREEVIGRSGNRTRKTLVFARLRQYASNQNDSKNDNYNTQCNFHLRTPPNIINLSPNGQK